MKVKLGCDPEFFIKDKGGNIISAYGIIPGSKNEPFRIENGAIQLDGMAVEVNIDPADTEDQFNHRIQSVLLQAEEMVKKYDKDLSIHIDPIGKFNPEYFLDQPFETKILGCDPDYDMDGNVRTPSDDLFATPVRTAAGHVHIGWTNDVDPHSAPHFEACKVIAKTFSKYPFFIPETESERERHKYYGGNSPFRPKSYGVELRGPSPMWIRQESSRRQMYRQISQKMETFK